MGDVLEVSDYFVFRLRGRTYALPPRSVEMVVPMQTIVAVPTIGRQVSGVIHVRGRIIAVVDLAEVLRVDDRDGATDSERTSDPDQRIVVVASRHPFAFVADATLGIWDLPATALTRCADEGPLVRGRIDIRGRAATVLDPHAVLDRLLCAGSNAAEAGDR